MKKIKILFIVISILLICLPIISCDKINLTNASSHPVNMNLIYSFIKDTTKKYVDSILIKPKDELLGYTPKNLPEDFILRSTAVLSKNGYIIINSGQIVELPDLGKIKIDIIYGLYEENKGLNCSSASSHVNKIIQHERVIHNIRMNDSVEKPGPTEEH